MAILLFIEGKLYPKEKSREDALLMAVKALPVPFPTVQQHLDDEQYQIKPQGIDFIITRRDGQLWPRVGMGNHLTNISLHGKNGTLFNTVSELAPAAH